ncbi:hypothetical protein MMC07_004057 [Pseudocyphellaria aurata]|nr:hypothetical protein [Pseudocyphellaria aurata]
MHYSRTLILIFAGLGLASPSPSRGLRSRPDARIDPSLKLPNYTAHNDLASFEERADELSERPLKKSLNLGPCTTNAGPAGVCVAIGAVIAQVGLGIAGLVKSDSNVNDCTARSGSIDDVTWKTYATGSNCGTTAQLNTIQSAITEYLEQQDRHICGVHCLKLSHGGTYNGYVTLAPAGIPLDNYYCGEYKERIQVRSRSRIHERDRLQRRVQLDKLLDSYVPTFKIAVNPLKNSGFASGVVTFDQFHYASDRAFCMISAVS